MTDKVQDKPISLGHTQSLIAQCLRSFLTSALRRQANGSAVEQDSPVTPSPISPRHLMVPGPSAGTPLTLRPKTSLNFEPRLHPGPPRRPAQHCRSPSWAGSTSRSFSTSFPEKRPELRNGFGQNPSHPPPSPGEEVRRIFRPLEDYIIASFTSFHCINSSFLIPRSQPHAGHGVSHRPHRPPEPPEIRKDSRSASYSVPELDPKLLLLGDVGENGTWWTGYEKSALDRTPSSRSQHGQSTVSSRNPHIDWAELEEWHAAVIQAARSWSDVYELSLIHI